MTQKMKTSTRDTNNKKNSAMMLKSVCYLTCCRISGWSSRIRRNVSDSLFAGFDCLRVSFLNRYDIMLSNVAQQPVQTIVSTVRTTIIHSHYPMPHTIITQFTMSQVGECSRHEPQYWSINHCGSSLSWYGGRCLPFDIPNSSSISCFRHQLKAHFYNLAIRPS